MELSYIFSKESFSYILGNETELSYILDKGVFKTLEYLRLEAYLEP